MSDENSDLMDEAESLPKSSYRMRTNLEENALLQDESSQNTVRNRAEDEFDHKLKNDFDAYMNANRNLIK